MIMKTYIFKMEKNLIYLIVFLMILLTINVNALELKLNVNPEYKIGEEVKFDYEIISDKTEVVKYLIFVDCPDAPTPLLNPRQINLEADKPFVSEYIYTSELDDTYTNQECKVRLSTIYPFELSKEKNFKLITNPSFSFELKICKSLDCTGKTKVFILDENIYLDYTSKVSEPIITATLIYPDSSTKQLNLPTTIKAEQIGTYELEVKASKVGYKTITKEIQFGVIEKEANIPYTKVKDTKVIPTKPKEIPRKSKLHILIPLIVAVILIIILIVYYFRKRKQTPI